MFSLGRVLRGASLVGWQWPGFSGQSWPSRVTWSFAPHQEGSCRAAPAPGELPAARRDPFSQFPWQNKQLSLITGCHGNRWTSRQFSGVCMCFCRGLRALPAHWLGFRAHHGPRQNILPSATCSLACPCHPAHAGTILIQEPPGTGHWGWQGHVPCTWLLPCVDTHTRKLCPMGWDRHPAAWLCCAPWEPVIPRGVQGALAVPGQGHSPPQGAQSAAHREWR